VAEGDLAADLSRGGWLTLIAPRSVLPPFAHLGEQLRFLAGRHSYEAELAHSSQPVGSRFAVFDWGGFGGMNTFLIYDESDKIALPFNLGASPAGAMGEMMQMCGGRVVRISGHSYRSDT
jgi:hypothetical protein